MSLHKYNLFIESIKKDLTPLQQNIVKSKWGNRFLDYDAPEKTNLIKDGKYQLDDTDRENVLNKLFKTDITWIKNYLSTISDNFLQTLKKSIVDKKVKEQFQINSFKELTYLQIKNLYGNNFRLLNPKETDSTKRILKDVNGKPILDDNKKIQYIIKEKGEPVFTNNLSNINSFIESWNKSYDEKIESKFDNDNFTTLLSFFDEDTVELNDFNLLNDKPIYLYITSHPSDTLNMSASSFFTSCQDIYRDTGYEKSALSNVFDINSKIAFLIYDTPYYKQGKMISKFLPLCRSVLRVVEFKDDNEKKDVFIDKTYPYRMEDTLTEYLEKYANIESTTETRLIYKSEQDIDWYDDLASPYQDSLSSVDRKVIGKNTKSLKWDYDLVDSIESKKTSIQSDNNVMKLIISIFDHDILDDTIDDKSITELFPKLKWLEWTGFNYAEDISDASQLVFKEKISINDSTISNLFWGEASKKLLGIELTNIKDTDNSLKMPDISEFTELIELNIFYTYRYLSDSILTLKNLKYLRISSNIEKYNKELLSTLKKNGIKITMIGL